MNATLTNRDIRMIHNDQPAQVPYGVVHRYSSLKRIMSAWLEGLWMAFQHRLTVHTLRALDRRMLEDLGVPHVGASRSAGPLDRFCEVIRPSTGF